MRQVRACGVILFRRTPHLAFLLMKHRHRFDLPKGHREGDETDLECALREMEEETGIPRTDVELDQNFVYQEVYHPVEARFGPEPVEKTLVIYLGWLNHDRPLKLTEHVGYEWRLWTPPHSIQRYTINPLLSKLAEHFAQNSAAMWPAAHSRNEPTTPSTGTEN